MGKLICSYIMPHPPIIVPEVGKGAEAGAAATVEAMKKAAAEIAGQKPTTLIVISPHAPNFRDFVYMPGAEVLEGNMARWGCSQVSFRFENNVALGKRITELAQQQSIPAGELDARQMQRFGIGAELDHGSMVPLYYICHALTPDGSTTVENVKLLLLSMSGLPVTTLYRFGGCVRQAIEDSSEDERIVVVASGDLSHCLTRNAPHPYSPKGKEFDDFIVECIANGDVAAMLERGSDDYLDEAAQCGFRSFIIMLGALDGFQLQTTVYSYEGPFGVGYAVAAVREGTHDESRRLLEKAGQEQMNGQMNKQMRMGGEAHEEKDPYVRLARFTLENYVLNGTRMPLPDWVPEEMLNRRAGAFVSLKKHGQLRGCIGTIAPTTGSIAQEIISNAVSAGVRDPRFEPVEADELEDIVYSVDVLGNAEPIDSMNQLDVHRYGVIVTSGMRRGLLLPDLEGVDTVQQQVDIALQKGGIRPGEPYKLERFEVIRHK